jgi:ribosome biogenesis GTPase A
MTTALRELQELLPSQDVVIEVLDARLPGSSSNPLLRQIQGDKPCIRVLTKSDLADPRSTAEWLEHLRSQPAGSAIVADRNNPSDARKRISVFCKDAARARGPDKTPRALIMGVPNVGKSSLVNVLMQRNVAATSDKPAVTKVQQSVVLKDGTKLTDSPGVMWPKISHEPVALRLALAGSIADTAIDYQVIGLFAADFFLEHYPLVVKARYKLPKLPTSGDALLQEIGRRRGLLRAGGIVELHRSAELLVHEFRSGILGRITLDVVPR